MDTWPKEYALVPSDDGPHITVPTSSLTRCVKWFSGLCLLIFVGIIGAVFGSVYPLPLPSPTSSSPPSLPTRNATNCGHTSASAIAAGCKMEPLTYAWMSPECYFPAVTDLHHAFRDIAWYRHENLTEPLSEEQLMRGEALQIWTDDRRYHLQHCLFLMRKLYYAVEHRTAWIDSKSLSATHVYHCVNQLEGMVDGVPIKPTFVVLGVYKCYRSPWAS